MSGFERKAFVGDKATFLASLSGNTQPLLPLKQRSILTGPGGDSQQKKQIIIATSRTNSKRLAPTRGKYQTFHCTDLLLNRGELNIADGKQWTNFPIKSMEPKKTQTDIRGSKANVSVKHPSLKRHTHSDNNSVIAVDQMSKKSKRCCLEGSEGKSKAINDIEGSVYGKEERIVKRLKLS